RPSLAPAHRWCGGWRSMETRRAPGDARTRRPRAWGPTTTAWGWLPPAGARTNPSRKPASCEKLVGEPAPNRKFESRGRRMFGQIAPRYDLLNHLLSLGIDIYWRRRAVRAAPPRGADPVLDLCTGTGDLALAYWRAGRGRVPVAAADFCRPMLEVGRVKA